MARTIHIPLPASGQRSPVFPDRCVSCGAAKEAESQLAVSRLIMRGRRQEQLALKYPIPHCQRCARSTKVMFLAGCIPFGLGAALVGIAAFSVVALGASVLGLDQYGTPGNANSLVVGAAAGLFAAIVGGFLFEVVARLILLPIFGATLLRTPLLALQLMSDSDYVTGLSGKLAADGSRFELTFANEDIAREFEALNARALGRYSEKR
jgi:hypothetical protein